MCSGAVSETPVRVPGMARVTITDVAEKAGVSAATVSNVINNRPGVSQSTRELVLQTIREVNYRPSGTARNLKRKSGKPCIGVVVKELDNPYYTDVASGIREYADSRGYTVFLTSSGGDYHREKTAINEFTVKDIDGIVIAPSLTDPEAEISHLFHLQELNFPFVLLEKIQGIRASVVDIDHIAATKSAVKYLIDAGHTQIVHFAGPDYTTHTNERIAGVRTAYSESHLVFNEEQTIVSAGAHLEDGYQTAMGYFQDRSPAEYPTAIVCFNDLIALGAVAALNDLGISVPAQVSIMGDDDIKFARRCPIPLSTIHTPRHELGQTAAEILIESIESPQTPKMRTVMLESRLVIRQSTRVLEPAMTVERDRTT